MAKKRGIVGVDAGVPRPQGPDGQVHRISASVDSGDGGLSWTISRKRTEHDDWGAVSAVIECFVDGPDTEPVEVIPADAPNVLTPDEARLLDKANRTAAPETEEEMRTFEALLDRLLAYAIGQDA